MAEYQVYFRFSKEGDNIKHFCYSDEGALQLVQDLEHLGLQSGGTPTNGRMGCQEPMHYRIDGRKEFSQFSR